MKAEQIMNFIDCGYNGLMIGKHGTGKTTLIKEVFTKMFGEQGVDWLYFSASTIDPWVDFIGIPKEVTDADGNTYLDFVRPRALATDKVQAIFLDEYNRSHKKVRNATMELIQFKSINGRRFQNLKVVWAAINPHEEDQDDQEETYSVDQLDPAQKDRFEVHIPMPYDVDDEYFIKKYGKVKGSGACHYWRGLPDKMKKMVSPRRLDYAMDAIIKGAHFRKYILPDDANPQRLTKLVCQGSPGLALEDMLKGNATEAKFKTFFKDPNNFDGVKTMIINDLDLASKVLMFVPQENLAVLLGNNRIEKMIFRERPWDFKELIADISMFGTTTQMKNRAVHALAKIKNTEKIIPDDLSALNVTASVTGRTQDAVDDTAANLLKIDAKMITVDYPTQCDNKPSVSLVAAITSAQIVIKETTSSFDRGNELACVAAAIDDCIPMPVALGLISVASMFCGRSQTETIFSSHNLRKIMRTAIAAYVRNGKTAEDIIDILKTVHPNIYVKFFGTLADEMSLNTIMPEEYRTAKEDFYVSFKK